METKLPVADFYRMEYLEYYCALPLEVRDGRLIVAAGVGVCPEVLRDFEQALGAPAEVVPADAEALTTAIREHFAQSSSTESLVRSLAEPLHAELDAVAGSDTDVTDLVNQPPVIRYVCTRTVIT